MVTGVKIYAKMILYRSIQTYTDLRVYDDTDDIATRWFQEHPEERGRKYEQADPKVTEPDFGAGVGYRNIPGDRKSDPRRRGITSL